MEPRGIDVLPVSLVPQYPSWWVPGCPSRSLGVPPGRVLWSWCPPHVPPGGSLGVPPVPLGGALVVPRVPPGRVLWFWCPPHVPPGATVSLLVEYRLSLMFLLVGSSCPGVLSTSILVDPWVSLLLGPYLSLLMGLWMSRVPPGGSPGISPVPLGGAFVVLLSLLVGSSGPDVHPDVSLGVPPGGAL